MNIEDIIDKLMGTTPHRSAQPEYSFVQQERARADLDRTVAELKELDVLVSEAELRLRARGWLA